MNALAGAIVGSVYGLTDEEIKAGIESLEPLGGRFKILKNIGMTVIDDCYNANPMSMKASLGVLSDVEERTVAILGDMGELGENEAALHREVGEAAGEMSIDAFVLVGELAKNIAEGIRSVNPDAEILWFATVDEALAEIKDVVRPGDVVLVKASHFMHFDRIVSELTV
jgi:UDP-N-acetylmuramoyl-tripeptide--D-alanyl-D-alanine ligase